MHDKLIEAALSQSGNAIRRFVRLWLCLLFAAAAVFGLFCAAAPPMAAPDQFLQFAFVVAAFAVPPLAIPVAVVAAIIMIAI